MFTLFAREFFDIRTNPECTLRALRRSLGRLRGLEVIKEALLPRRRLIIDVLCDTAANGKCQLSVLKTERLACEDPNWAREVCVTRPNNPCK